MRKKLTAFAVSLICGIMFFSQTAFALIPYTSYSFSSVAEEMNSPHGLQPVGQYDGNALNVGTLRGATDLFVSEEGNIYIADAAGSRVLVFDSNVKLIRELRAFVDPALEIPELVGKEGDPSVQSLNSPEGVFVDGKGHIYISDTGNKRILEFDKDFLLIRQIPEPKSEILPEDFTYLPSSLAVDTAGRIYVLVKNVNKGVVELSSTGEFTGFVGAQKVKATAFDVITSFFLSEEQRDRMQKTIPRQYNNIAIDDVNFLWLTTDAIGQWDQFAATIQRNRSTEFAPVKRLNPNGDDVLIRSGYFPPSGDVGWLPPSAIVDVAFKANGVYSILDRQRNKIFTYDNYGNLLYAMAGTGTQVGNFTRGTSLAYGGDDLYVLDGELGTLTKFVLTEYGRLLEEALNSELEREFDKSFEYWSKVIDYNNNFDLAYVGIARVFLRQGDYEKAMEYYKQAENIDGYSKSFKEYRKGIIKDWILLVPVTVILVLYLMYRWSKYTAKYNKKTYNQLEKYGLKEELIYAFHVIFHPFDGFWDLKHEKRGSFRGANIILCAVILTFVYKAMGTGYIFNPYSQYVDVIQEIMNVLIPMVLWCSSSWALTTLFSGEGSLKDIYITTAYALLPLVLFNIPVTLVSNIMVLEELSFMNFFVNLSFAWSLFLIIIGNMIIQDYTFVKNLLTTAFSVVCMGVELFLALLLIMLTNNIIGFFSGIYEEVIYRL